MYGKFNPTHIEKGTTANEGFASRFFPQFRYSEADLIPFIYQAKPSPSERDAGLESLPTVTKVFNGQNATSSKEMKPVEERFTTEAKNFHPTVKSLSLMSWLIKLVTPPGGVVLDPFAGSGSTLVAAQLNNFQYIGVEKEQEYFELANRRLAWARGENGLFALEAVS